MDMGNEISKDACPEKYYAKSGIVKDIAPVIIAMIIVALFSLSGRSSFINIIIEVCFIFTFGLIFYYIFSKMKKNLSETCISVCENGIYGIRAVAGFKKIPFCIEYYQIKRAVPKGDRLLVDTKESSFVIILENSENTADLINTMLNCKD